MDPVEAWIVRQAKADPANEPIILDLASRYHYWASAQTEFELVRREPAVTVVHPPRSTDPS
jgi:hypothetical protein